MKEVSHVSKYASKAVQSLRKKHKITIREFSATLGLDFSRCFRISAGTHEITLNEATLIDAKYKIGLISEAAEMCKARLTKEQCAQIIALLDEKSEKLRLLRKTDQVTDLSNLKSTINAILGELK